MGDTLKFLSREYEVRMEKTVSDLGAFGRLNYGQLVIDVATDLHIANRRMAVIHEVIHGISAELELDLDEVRVVALASGINSFLVENGFDMKRFDKWVD